MSALVTKALSAPFCALDQEIFEKERILTAIQGSTAGQARYFPICNRPGLGFNPNNLAPVMAAGGIVVRRNSKAAIASAHTPFITARYESRLNA